MATHVLSAQDAKVGAEIGVDLTHHATAGHEHFVVVANEPCRLPYPDHDGCRIISCTGMAGRPQTSRSFHIWRHDPVRIY